MDGELSFPFGFPTVRGRWRDWGEAEGRGRGILRPKSPSLAKVPHLERHSVDGCVGGGRVAGPELQGTGIEVLQGSRSATGGAPSHPLPHLQVKGQRYFGWKGFVHSEVC